jgi:opacity protein-like surface antigen
MMRLKRTRAGIFASLLLLTACLVIAYADEIKIKVVAENATIRMKPSVESDVIEDAVPLNSVFAAMKKEGEWYEIRYRSKVGVLVTGYIHQMYVAEVKEEQPTISVTETVVKEPIKQTLPSENIPKKFAVSLGFGIGSGSFINSASSFSYSWGPFRALDSISENGTINHSLKNPFGLGFSLSYEIASGFGVCLKLDYNFKQTLTTTTEASVYKVIFHVSGGTTISGDKKWDASGELSLLPVSLNAFYRIPTGSALVPYVTAGVTYFTGKFSAATTTGYAYSWVVSTTQYIDYLSIPLKIDKSLSAIGGNIGAGLDFYLSPGIALNVDAVYFLGAKSDETWQVAPGTYPANWAPALSFIVNQADAGAFQEKISKLNLNLSYFKFGGGIKILF